MNFESVRNLIRVCCVKQRNELIVRQVEITRQRICDNVQFATEPLAIFFDIMGEKT